MASVNKAKYVVAIRAWADKFLIAMPLPKIHPDVVSAAGLFLSVYFVFIEKVSCQVIVLSGVLLLDWLDGIIAKKYHFRKNEKEEEQGWMTDVVVDRFSEGIIFLKFFVFLFPLFVLNVYLSLRSYQTGKHFILPLRQALLIYLVFKLF